MTTKEIQEKIIGYRLEIQRLEDDYEVALRNEQSELIDGKRPKCDNCAYSCCIAVDDHNVCIRGKCTCCNDWCVSWIPENEVSAFLREHYHYDDKRYYALEDLFGYDFLKKSVESPKMLEKIIKMLELIIEDDKLKF